MKCGQPWLGDFPSSLTQLWAAPLVQKLFPTVTPTLPACELHLSQTSGDTRVLFMLHMRPSQVCKYSTQGFQSSNCACPLINDSPVSCPACPGRALTWHCPFSPTIWCPKENEIFQNIPKKRIIALDLEVDAEIKCKPFSLAVSQIHSENVCSHLAVAHCLIPGSGLPGTGCDAKVFLLFVLVVIVAPSAVLHSP